MSYLSRSMKKVGRSVGRSNPAAIARQVMFHAQIKKHILKEVGKVLQRDIKRACQIKTASLLRKRSAEDMCSFSWASLLGELKKNAPVFVKLLTDCVVRKRKIEGKRSHCASDDAIVGVCASILLRHRNQEMNLIQRIISMLLYSNHAPVQV